MNYLTLENVSKHYGEKVLFEDISLHISQGDKVALVAKNGSGKSTLMRVVAGLEGAEGENRVIYLHKNVSVGILHQEPAFADGDTVFSAVTDAKSPAIQAIREYEHAMLHPEDATRMQAALSRMEDLEAWDIESRIKEVLFRLKLTQFEQSVSTLSGGQRKRLALARLILQNPDFLILDEPTNHLDLDMIEWLEEFLQRATLTLFMVTHDRYFLDRVCNRIVELDRGKIHNYSGNYSDFLEKKATRSDVEAGTLDRSRKLLKRELEWVRRMPKARGTKSKARVGAFKALRDEVSQYRTEEDLQIQLKGARLGSKIVELHNVSKAYGEQTLIQNFDYKFKKNERVGIVGPNGSGKSTLLQILTGRLRPDSGKAVIGDTVQFGFYAQEGMQLKEDQRIIDVVRDIAEYIPLEKGQKLYAPALLERFLFERPKQQVFVSQLSGGERRRLFLLTVLMRNPNFLILDEPTNDLDIVTLNVLEEFLLDFPGCVIIVSHDRYFMDKIVDHLFVFEGEGQIRDFNGTYSEYRTEQQLALQAEREAKDTAAKEAAKAQAAAKSTKVDTISHAQRKNMNRIERKLKKLEEQKKTLHDKFSDSDITPEDIEKWSVQLSQLNDEIEELEMEWLELSEG